MQTQGGKPILHNAPQTAQLAERVAGWQVRYGVVEEELRRQNVSFVFFLRLSPSFLSSLANAHALPP